jgi:predicted dehydrogenase
MKLNVAIIGSSKSAAEHHIPAYLRIRETEIVAIADADSERAQSVAKQFGIKGVYDDYAVMLKRRRPQIVSVCTGPSEHRDPVLCALSRGAHVLCDMPMGLSAQEGQDMVDAAETAERVLVFAAPRRFESEAIAARQAIENRDLGEICLANAWARRKTIPAEDYWQIKSGNGGGALSASGQEMLDLALWLLGDHPISVSGQLFHRFPKNPDIPKTWFGSRRELDAEDLAIAIVRCQKTLVTLEVDWLCSSEECGVQIVGAKGRGCTSPFRMEFAGEGQLTNMTPTFFPESSVWNDMIRSFVEAIQGNRKPFPDLKETLRVQRVCDAIRQSSESGREVLLSGL